jgi:hypothetical protein
MSKIEEDIVAPDNLFTRMPRKFTRHTSHVKLAEDISLVGQSIYPNGGKTPYKGNQEMSDKSRNGL